MANRDLELRIVAKNLASSVLKTVQEDLKKVANSTGGFGGIMNKTFSGVTSALKSISPTLKTVGGAFSSVFLNGKSVLETISDTVFSLKTLLMGLFSGIGIGEAIKHFIDLNAEFEKMKVTMDVLTKGHGEEWFNRLNQWALGMPISMAEVSKAFITMKAYGLEPTLKLMENMVNVASVLPESGRAITGIARAIGQIQAKSRLEGQELRQLAEWAVPGYEAVYTKIFKKISERTGKSVSELKFTMIDSSTAIKAILETMEEHFGGAAQRIGNTWSGMWIKLTNFAKEFFREIGESGLFKNLEQKFAGILSFIQESFKSGKFQQTTKMIGDTLTIAFESFIEIFKSLFDIKGPVDWGNVYITVLNKLIQGFTLFINTISGIKLVLDVVKLAWVYFAEGLNTIIFGIIWSFDKLINGWKYLVDLLPTSIPGIKSVQNAFKSVGGFMDNLTQGQKENLGVLDNMVTETNKDIISTANAMTTRSNISIEAIKRTTEVYEKFKKTAASPPQILGDVPQQEKQLTIAEQINKIMSEPHHEMKGQVGKDYKELADQLIETAGTFDQIRFAYLAWEGEGRKGSFFKEFKKIFQDFNDTLKNGYSSALQGMIDGTMSFQDAFHSVMKTIKTAFIKVVSDMAAEWMAKQTMMLLKHILIQDAMTTATAEGETERLGIESVSAIKSIAIAVGSAIKRITIYAYEAAAAAFKAIAGIPFVGPFLAIGAGAAALGLVLGFASKIAGFEKGTGLMGVRETGPANLHKGEIVLNRKESNAYRQGITEGGGGAANNMNFSFNISALDGGDVERVVRKTILPLIRENIRDNGIGKTMIREAR